MWGQDVTGYFSSETSFYSLHAKKKKCACVRLISVLVRYVLCTRYVCTWYQPAEICTYVRYVPDTYVPGISRQKSMRTYVMFRPWTHTSDDSHIYQLSLVVATATVSLFFSDVSPDVDIRIFCCLFVVYIYMFGWLCRATCSVVSTLSMLGVSHAIKNEKKL